MRRGIIASGLRRAALAMAAFIASTSIAEAQAIGGRVITFGDSLSDNGNLPPGLAPPPPYLGGRFSNGIVWTEILSGGAQNSPTRGQPNAGAVNFAFGGALVDNGLNLLGPIPGIPTQVGLFQLTGGAFTSRDLVTMWGGANNVFQYFQSTPPALITQAGLAANSTTAATAMTQNVAQVVGLGARTVLVANLPDIGATPNFNTTAGAAGATFATGVFNQTLSQGLQGVAAGAPAGTNIIQMDVNRVFALIAANPAAYGFTNTTQACTAVLACVTAPTAVQNQFAFWDGVHPTAAGHRLLALYAGLLLNPQPTTQRIAPLGEVAVRTRGAAVDETFDRTSGWAQGQYGRQNGFYANVTGSTGDVSAHDGVPGYRVNMGGARFGLDRNYGQFLVGGSAGVSLGDIDSSTLKSSVSTLDGDVYAAMLSGPFYVAAQAGISTTRFDAIKRANGFGPDTATSQTGSYQLSSGAEVGVIGKFGVVTLVPAARLQYVHANVDGFSESGLLANAFTSRNLDTVSGSVRLKASTPIGAGTAFAQVGYEQFLSQSQDQIGARFVDNTALPFQAGPGNLVAKGVSLKLGYEGRFSELAAYSISYGANLQDGNGTTHTGQAQIKVPF